MKFSFIIIVEITSQTKYYAIATDFYHLVYYMNWKHTINFQNRQSNLSLNSIQ